MKLGITSKLDTGRKNPKPETTDRLNRFSFGRQLNNIRKMDIAGEGIQSKEELDRKEEARKRRIEEVEAFRKEEEDRKASTCVKSEKKIILMICGIFQRKLISSLVEKNH